MAEVEERRGRKRHRWGPPAAVPEPVKPKDDTPETKPTRKRKSRWGDDAPPKPAPKSDEERALMVFPEKVVLSSGLTINLPPTLTGRAPNGDPEVLEFHKQVRSLQKPTEAVAEATVCDLRQQGLRAVCHPPAARPTAAAAAAAEPLPVPSQRLLTRLLCCS